MLNDKENLALRHVGNDVFFGSVKSNTLSTSGLAVVDVDGCWVVVVVVTSVVVVVVLMLRKIYNKNLKLILNLRLHARQNKTQNSF